MISVVVCTYNRANLLQLAVESLLNQTSPVDNYEIIVVDNNSSDTTREVVGNFNKDNRLTYFLEEKQGLSYARNRGWQKARYEYVAYIDDDAKVPADYIEKIIKIIREQDPDVIGGPVFPYYLHKKPEWYKDEYEVLITYEKTGWLPKDKSICGSNMVFKRELLSKYNGFNPDYGMKGKEMWYGEESYLIYQLHKDNARIYYDHELVVYHIVADFKTNLLYNFYRHFEQGKARGDIISEKIDITDVNFQNQLARLVDSLSTVFNNVKTENTRLKDHEEMGPLENVILEEILLHFFQVGVNYQVSKKMLNKKPGVVRKILKINPERVFYRFKKLFGN